MSVELNKKDYDRFQYDLKHPPEATPALKKLLKRIEKNSMTWTEFKKQHPIPWYYQVLNWFEERWREFKVLIGRCDHSATIGVVGSKESMCLYCHKNMIVKDFEKKHNVVLGANPKMQIKIYLKRKGYPSLAKLMK